MANHHEGAPARTDKFEKDIAIVRAVVARLAFHEGSVRTRLSREIARRFKRFRYETRIEHSAIEQPRYGYCVLHAAKLAKKLGRLSSASALSPLLAINEFNAGRDEQKICKTTHPTNMPYPETWYHQIYIYRDLGRPDYCRFVSEEIQQLTLATAR